MLIRNYQAIDRLDSGSTTYFLDIAKILQIDLSCTPAEIQEELGERVKYKSITLEERFSFKDKWYWIEKDLTKLQYIQFVLLEQYIDDDVVQNLHNIIALFCRPEIKSWFRRKVEPFNQDTHEALANEFLDLDMSVANALIVFFWELGNHSLRHMRIQFLNKMKIGNQ